MKFCPYCGSEIIPNAKFCIECGNDLSFINNYDNTVSNVDNDSIEKYNQENINLTEDNKIENNMIQSSKDYESNNEITIQQNLNDNFDIKRPTITSNNNMEESRNNNEVNEIVFSQFLCPSCKNHMHKTTKSGFLSKSNYHSCKNCSLTFKETNNMLILEEEPEFTRIKSKLHHKRCSYGSWLNIFNGAYYDDIFGLLYKWDLDAHTNIPCPACNHSFDRYKFGVTYLICSGCFLILQEHKNGQYKLYDTLENYSPLWKYENQSLTLDEMRNIFINEQSEETLNFRREIVKSTDKQRQEEQNKIIREQNDLALFNQSLETGNPLLPTPTDTVIVLKKNEIPIYKINKVFLSEPRAVRTSNGRYGGTSVRVMKGVTVHSGRSTSQSESHDVIKRIDNGDLLITNQRIIFLGNNRTTNIDMKKIIAITTNDNQIQVQRSNKQKPEYFNNVNSTQNILINGREYTIEMNADMIKKLIIGLI